MELTPSGSKVVQPGVNGLGDFFRQLGGIAVNGISRRVDLELAGDARQPDTSEIATQVQPQVEPPGFGSIFTNLTPLQLGGLAVAGGLAWALATGKFR